MRGDKLTPYYEPSVTQSPRSYNVNRVTQFIVHEKQIEKKKTNLKFPIFVPYDTLWTMIHFFFYRF